MKMKNIMNIAQHFIRILITTMRKIIFIMKEDQSIKVIQTTTN